MSLPRTPIFVSSLILIAAALPILSCSNDEDSLRPPSAAGTLNIEFENAKVIDVNSMNHQALLLTTGEGTSRTAIQLVDLSSRSVVASHILIDYLELYDVKFISDTLACFAGKPHGSIGYAVQFISLPSLTLGTRLIVTSETGGDAGFLAVDSAGTYVYYSHAGGGDRDGVYKIRVSNRTIVDADNDGQEPYVFDNGLVSGLFDAPARVFFNDAEGRIVVANPAMITMINANLWGTLTRADSLSFADVPGVSHLAAPAGTNADMMAYGAGIYVFGGSSGNQPQLSRFEVESSQLDMTRALTGVTWWHDLPAIFIHPRADIVSVFTLRRGPEGVAVGQYGLDQLNEVAASPYHTRTIADTSISTFSLDIVSNKLIIADKDHPRLELINIE